MTSRATVLLRVVAGEMTRFEEGVLANPEWSSCAEPT